VIKLLSWVRVPLEFVGWRALGRCFDVLTVAGWRIKSTFIFRKNMGDHRCNSGRPLSPVFFSGSRAKLESFCHYRKFAVTLCLTQTGIGQRPFDI